MWAVGQVYRVIVGRIVAGLGNSRHYVYVSTLARLIYLASDSPFLNRVEATINNLKLK